MLFVICCHMVLYGYITKFSYFVGTGALQQFCRHHTSGGQIDVRNHRSCRSWTHMCHCHGRSWSAPGRHRWAPGRHRWAPGRHRSATDRDRWTKRRERRGNNNEILLNEAHHSNAFVCRRFPYSVCASGEYPCFAVHYDQFLSSLIAMLVIIFRCLFVEGRAKLRKHRQAHLGCLGPVPRRTGRRSTRLRRWSLSPTCHHQGDIAR